MSARDHMTPTVEFGSTSVEFVCANDIKDLRQIRQSYDKVELETLADRITVDETNEGLNFHLINPPTIARFDDITQLGLYLDSHQQYYGLAVGTHDDILHASSSDGNWHIRVNGHRRGLAVALKCRQQNIPLETVMVASTLLSNPSFDEARQKQCVENTSSPIKPAEDALSLELEYAWRWQQHPSEPIEPGVRHARIRELSKFTGHSADKVRAALQYVTVPESIREFTDKGLSYSNIVSLARLRDSYAAKRNGQELELTAEQADQRMRDYFERTILRLLSGANKSAIGGAIEGKIKEVNQTAAYVEDGLFIFDEEVSRASDRKGVRKHIAQAAVLALQFADLSPQDCDKILEIIGPRLAQESLDS